MGKTGFNVRSMFAQSYYALPLYHKILYIFSLTCYHFTCLPIPEVDIVWIKNYDYNKYFSIDAWVKSGGSCDAKVKDKYKKTTK